MMKGGLGNMMKQAQQMQANMQKAQEEIANMEVTGQSAGGIVQVTMTGKHVVKRVALEDDVMEEEKDFLEDMLAAAVNDAVAQIESESAEKMQAATAGMKLPPGMNLPF